MGKAWAYDVARQVFICAHPGCGYEHKEPGAVQLHYAQKHGQRRRAAAAPPADPGGRVCSCGGRLRVLRQSGAEAAARREGYQLVCGVCGDLYE